MGLKDFLFRTKNSTKNSIQNNLSSAYASIMGHWNFHSPLISPLQAYKQFERIASIHDAVSRIADSGAIIPVYWADEKGERTDSELVDFLQTPGIGTKGVELLKELIISDELTSSSYLLVRGNITQPPLQCQIIYPFNVTVGALQGGTPTSLTITQPQQIVFSRLLIDGRERYIDQSGLNELIPIVTRRYRDQWQGLSKLGSVWYEIVQTSQGNEHNAKLLANGVKLSGVITPNSGQSLNEVATKQASNAITEAFAGSSNAGKVAFLGFPVNWQPLNGTMADMDWINLLTANKEAIYNTFRIPLAMISSSSMTMDNLKVSDSKFYTDAVLPTLQALYSGIVEGLLPRYKREQGGSLQVDTSQIEVLKARTIDNLTVLKEKGVITINEARSKMGIEDIDGGDKIYQNVGLMPLPSGNDGG